MAARKRRESETFNEYREALKEEAKEIKAYLKGRLWWNSHKNGTYKRRS